MKLGDQVKVTCDRLSYGGGRGVARHDGAVIFIPGAAPEEKLYVEISKVHKNFYEAKIVDILNPSKHRREPKCLVFGRCGGCVWQHINYEEQVAQKKSLLKWSLNKSGADQIEPEMISAESEYAYRNRAQLHVKNQEVGFYARKSNTIVPTSACPICEESIDKKIQSLQKSPPNDGKYEIRSEYNGHTSVRDLNTSPYDFRQVNSQQNQKLIELVVQLASRSKPERILELFAGEGNFSFPLAQKLSKTNILAVDNAKKSIRNGQRRAHLENVTNLEFVQADVEKYIQKNDVTSSLVIVDPPRTGLQKDTVRALLSARPKTLIYISCHLSSLERDLKLLSQAYSVQSAYGIDMFPQTDYVESVISMEALSP